MMSAVGRNTIEGSGAETVLPIGVMVRFESAKEKERL